MADFDWENIVHSITFKDEDAIYVGEAKIVATEGYKPNGAGAFYSKKDNILLVSEDMVDKNGAAIKADSKETALGILKNGYIDGPAIFAGKNIPLRFTPSCKENDIVKYAYVQMDNFDEYYICQYTDKGEFTGKTIHYKMGRFYLEVRKQHNIESTPIREIICDWDYKPFYYSFMAQPIEFNKAIRPLNVTGVTYKGKPFYNFQGGAQINSKKLSTYTLDDETFLEYIKEDANGYGLVGMDKNSMYVGQFKNNKPCGLGCISYGNGNKYVGFVEDGSPYGLGLLVNNKETIFSSFVYGTKHGLTFEFNDDSLFIKVYDEFYVKKIKHDYFEVDLKTFNIKKHSIDSSYVEDIPFSASDEEIKELTMEDKMSPRLKKILEDYEYEFNSDEELIITKCHLKKKTIMVPTPVVYIRPHTFENLPVEKIIFSDSVKHVNNEAIYNCKNLKEIEFSKSMTSISTDITNKLTTKAIVIPKNIDTIASSFRYCKINKAFIKNPECRFYSDSFPPGCKIYVEGKLLGKKELDAKRRSVVSKTTITTTTKKAENKPKNKKEITPLVKKIKRKYSIWSQIGNFFKELPSTIASIFAIPFKIGLPKLDWLALIITLLGITSVILGLTGVLDKIIWTVEFNPSFGYSFNMSSNVFEYMTENVGNLSEFILYGIWLFIATVILWIVDLILIVVLFIASLLWLLIQSVGQIALLYLIPIIVPVLLFLRLKSTNENNTNFVKCCLAISIVTIVIYFMAIIIIKSTNATPLVEFITPFINLK